MGIFILYVSQQQKCRGENLYTVKIGGIITKTAMCAFLRGVNVAGLICYTTDDVIETYCLKRTMKGLQAMMEFNYVIGTEQVEDGQGEDGN